jgi:trimethylamine--corrinoid protein Co-methyltransferase
MFTSVLTDDQICRIHAASLAILERTGVVVPHAEMLRLFAGAGAQVEFEQSRVRIPPAVVEELLSQAGRRFTIYGRDLERTAVFGGDRRNFNSIAGEALWVDEPGAERRYTTLRDVTAATRMGDALDMITIAGAMADPTELPVNWRCVAVAGEMLAQTTKPITFWFHDRASAEYLVELVTAVRGSTTQAKDYPLFYPLLEPISPLHFPYNGIDLLFETARVNMPVQIGPMAQMGLSAPATVAGTMAQENAEILAGICITQLVRAGMPVCYGGICHAFDMRTTQMIFAGPEQALFGVGMTQMGKHYGLPVYVNVGLTDAKRPDAQAGLETAATLLPAAAAGADIFGHMGIAGVDQASSLDMLVLQNEVIRYVESACRELRVDAETLALDLVDEVGPGGTFIDKVHTAEHYRAELWFPELLDREYYDAWRRSGAKDMAQSCRARKEEIARTHAPEPMSDDMAREVARIVDAARRNL